MIGTPCVGHCCNALIGGSGITMHLVVQNATDFLESLSFQKIDWFGLLF